MKRSRRKLAAGFQRREEPTPVPPCHRSYPRDIIRPIKFIRLDTLVVARSTLVGFRDDGTRIVFNGS